ncbi:SMP-30/gluconolactonase/LRE family protein [Sunxiuqinia dokdonensis]|uniref:SMP-30/gluconolactonase/LRE family protein n=1 Tax=Sunxiuqinia dokdonensis TaxID=1409788 RepID=UPI0009E775DE|nr:SMP-30/gluconolactonase/LRE family protein [Sunxiuqinia dokdonensis]
MKTFVRLHFLCVICCLAVGVSAQKADALSKLIKPNAEVEKIASGFAFTEGPAPDQKGQVYFTDQPNNKIYIWKENDQITEFEVDGERANGLYFDQDGQLVACADYQNKLIKIDQAGNKTVLVDNYDGKHLNGPNDLWIHPSGNIYLTDSYYHRPWWPEGHTQVQDERAVYCVTPAGKITRVAADFKMPNGIIGTRDGSTLYVADINDQKIWKYDIQQDGSLSNKTFFAPEGSDGMTIDHQGNVYLTNQAVSVYSKKGEKLGAIQIPEQPANVCFGGKNRKTLFITARTSVYKLAMKVAGVQ